MFLMSTQKSYYQSVVMIESGISMIDGLVSINE